MRRGLAIGVFGLVAVSALLLLPAPRADRPRGLTWIELTDAGSGRTIFAGALGYDEQIVLTWKNSLFNLTVTEVFAARAGRLDLTRVTFAPGPRTWTTCTIPAGRSRWKACPALSPAPSSGSARSATPR